MENETNNQTPVQPTQTNNGGAEKKKSGLGLASLILGIISVVICWIPVLNVLCYILGILAVVFAIVCFVKKASVGKAIAGIICGGLSLIIAIAWTALIGTAVNEVAKEAKNNPDVEDIFKDIEDNLDDIDFDTDSDSKTAKIGKAFKFDNFEITVGEDITFTTVDNQFSDAFGKDIIRIPLTIKNVGESSDHISSYDYKVFGPNGTEIDDVDIYFEDDSMFLPGDLRPGASYTKYAYHVFDGNGTYAIEFSDWDEKVTVEFEVTK